METPTAVAVEAEEKAPVVSSAAAEETAVVEETAAPPKLEPSSSIVEGTPQFTDKDIEYFCTELFPHMESYREEDKSISSTDVPALIKKMNWDRTEEQVKQYVHFWDTNFAGRMPMDLYRNILKVQHDKYELLREYAVSFDKNGDVYISPDEFNFGVETLLVHDPTLQIQRVKYDDFVKEADKNHDGKVSIEELTSWLEKFKLTA